MAPGGREKRSKAPRRDGPRAIPRPQPEFCASIVSPEELCHITRGLEDAPDRTAAVIAERQLGLITIGQLQAVGLHKDAITTRCRRRSLTRIHSGVYLLGGPPPVPGARELAAILALGHSAVVSHRSAAAMWGLAAVEATVEVTIVGGSARSRDRVKVHRAGGLDPLDRATRHGIPLTGPARTLIDFAATAADTELDRALSEARVQRLVNDRNLAEALSRAGNRAGVGRLRGVLAREDESEYTALEAERRMRQLVKQARLPRPTYGAIVEGWPVDLFWPEHRLVVEIDGYQFHGHRGAFERDRRKDAMLVAAGFRVIRITWRQLTEEPLAVAAALASALAVSRGPG